MFCKRTYFQTNAIPIGEFLRVPLAKIPSKSQLVLLPEQLATENEKVSWGIVRYVISSGRFD